MRIEQKLDDIKIARAKLSLAKVYFGDHNYKLKAKTLVEECLEKFKLEYVDTHPDIKAT